MKMMLSAIAAAVLMTVPALAQTGDAQTDIVSYSCEEHRELTGQDLCNMHQTLKTSRARLEGMRKAAQRKQCLAKAVETYGEEACSFRVRLWTGDVPNGFEGCQKAKAACDDARTTPKKPTQTIDVWK